VKRAAVALIVAALTTTACTDGAAPAAIESSAPFSSAGASSTAPTSSSSTSTTVLDLAARSAALQAVVDDFVAHETARFSVVVVELSTGARAEHLADRRLPSASLYKLFVARELLRRIAAGTLSRDRSAGDGEGRTVGECVHDMIVVSDNACGMAGLQIVGRGALDRQLHAAGYVSTSLASPQQTSADDVARFLIQARDDPHERELYDLLRTQQVNDRLPQDLPPGTPIAHKTGDIRHYAHDAGVITTPHGDVVLAVLSGPWALPCCDADHPGPSERVAFGAIARLGRAVYDAIA
jgi:beta-lactamase class A